MKKIIKKSQIDKILPVIISDMLFEGLKPKDITDKKVKEELYLYFIREMYDSKIFGHHEKENEPAERTGCYIKGYVRDVWAYLKDAYTLVHDESYSEKIKTILKKINEEKKCKQQSVQYSMG